MTEGTRLVSILSAADYEHEPGQHVGLRFLPDARETHYFSFASAAHSGAPGLFELLVGTSKNSTDLPFVPGAALELGAPSGEKILKNIKSEAPLVLVSMGTGVAPLRSLVQAEVEKASARPVTLLAGAKSALELPFYDEFAALAEERKLRFFPVFSGESAGAVRRGWVQAYLPEVIQPEAFYAICGSVPMVEATKQILLSLGVPPTSMHGEGYGG